ncbi:DUF7594 domain-containing protein [Rubritalea squalenifaciens]|nr:hypothetical protein [Rubritalea squalenifaciens]
MQTKKIIPLITLCAGTLNAATVAVTEDGWIDNNDNAVKDGGTGVRLNIATPNTSNIQQYTRVAYFGFDVSSINLATVTSATFRVTGAPDISGSYNGQNVIRFYLVDNNINDLFDETTLTDTNAPGHSLGDRLSEQRTAGVIIGDVAVGDPASNQAFEVNFSASAIADLANDSNSFLTIVAEYRGQNNTGYNPPNITGLGFVSKEGGTGSATLELIPEPSTSVMGSLTALGFLLRRKRK